MKTGIQIGKTGFKGGLNQLLAANLDRILALPGRRLYRRYIDATQNAEAAQLDVLREILRWSANTEIGRRFGFERINSHDEYCRAVPVMDYEQHRAWVDRHAAGEENVLFPGKPMLFTRTSGTTASPKLIPISPFNFERTIRDRGKLWLYTLSKNFPGIFSGKDFTLVSPAIEGHTDGGIPFGSLSGMVYQNIPEFMKLVHTIPYEVLCVPDFDAKAYGLLRFGVPSHVTSIFTGNPSTVLNLAEKADRWKSTLIRDIRDGTLSTEFDFQSETRALLQGMLKPAPERAAALEEIANQSELFRPAEYWPDLKLIHTWTNGNCRLVLPRLRRWFRAETPILDFGYIASEITATDIVDPKTNGSLLALRSGFYEFSAFEEEHHPTRFFMAHELEVGRRYYIYVTTYSGLYRYDMNDVVEVVGYFNQAPILIFRFKGKGITNLEGEKLSETQLIEAVQDAAQTTGISHEFFVALAEATIPGYKLYIEFTDPDGNERCDHFAAAVDDALCRFNIEYNAKRASDRLKPLSVVPLCQNSFEKYRRLRLAEGAFEGQLKWLHLSESAVNRHRMEKLILNS